MADPNKSLRRPPEQILADLRAEIRRVRELKQEKPPSSATAAALRAVETLDSALDAAEDERDVVLRRALQDAREMLAAALEKRGAPVTKARTRRRR